MDVLEGFYLRLVEYVYDDRKYDTNVNSKTHHYSIEKYFEALDTVISEANLQIRVKRLRLTINRIRKLR